DHAEQFPWMVSTNEGGTREFVDQGGVLFHFRAISNEVTTPKVLACVTDRSRTRATSFAPVPNGPSSVYLNNATTQISYFVGLDADETRPQSILSGDRNVTGATPSKEGILSVSNNTQLSFTKELHNGVGNIGLADGSAAQVTAAALNKQVQAALLSTTGAWVRRAFPK